MVFRDNPIDIKYFDYQGIPTFVALLGTSMEGTPLVAGIYASTSDKPGYKWVLFGAITTAGILNLMVSVISYLAYGTTVKEIVIMNLS